MNDDIVTRLRAIAPIHEGRKRHECISEAADEIERLRKELQSYYDEDEEIRRGRSGE